MSVINKMLKDLEDRRAASPPDAPVLQGLSGPPPRSVRSRKLLWLMLVALIAGGGALAWYLSSPSVPWTPIAVKHAAQPEPDAPKADLVINQAPLEPIADAKRPAVAEPSPSPQPARALSEAAESGAAIEPPRVALSTATPQPDPPAEIAEADSGSHVPEALPAPRVHTLTPSPVLAKPGYQTITLKGEYIPAAVRAWINWGENGDGKFLMPWQVKWQDADTLRLVISTGEEPDRWSVVLYGQGTLRSEPFKFSSRKPGQAETVSVGTPSAASPVDTERALPEPASEDKSPRREPVRTLSAEQRARRAHQRAETVLSQGRYAEAEAALRLALDLEPARRGSLSLLVGLYMRDGRYQQAEQALSRARGLGVAGHETTMLLARVRVAQNRAAEALEMLSAAAPVMSEAPDYHALMAALLQRSEQHDRAADIYRGLVALRPNQANWWMGLAIAQHEQGEARDALLAYRRARDLGGLTPKVRAFLAERIRLLESAR